MPAALHASISDLRIGREALEMSVSPRQNFLNPPPVPEMPTVTRTLPRTDCWKSSATASVMGKTVLDPSILTSCARAGAAGASSAMAAEKASVAWDRDMDFIGNAPALENGVQRNDMWQV